MLSNLATPLRALLVALGSVFLAWAFFEGGVWIVAAIAIAIILIVGGLVLDALGQAALGRDRVSTGIWLMESWMLVPSGIAAVAAAVVIIVAILLVAPETASSDVKELIGALSTGITAFLATVFIDPSGEDADSAVSSRIQGALLAEYGGRAAPDSRLGQVLNEGAFADPNGPASAGGVGTVSGWGHGDRRKRARVIIEEL